ncbi:MAG TPA: TrkA family potassium uptake protein [Longimicrobiaceae bacterium]|nr:TrkA family potassium uptake protein [Longimicrobiaceae bacterium]
MKRFVVIGLGSFGVSVAESLHARGYEVVALDIDEAAVDRIARHATRAVVGDGREVATLQRIGAEGADAAVVSTGRSITASILATMALRDLGVPEIYVDVVSRNQARVLEKLGVTETIFPERESGLRLARRIASVRVLNYIDVGDGFGVQEMTVPASWVGRRLRELDLRRTYGVSAIAVHDVQRNVMTPIPDLDVELSESNTLVVAGREEDLARAADAK